MLQIGKINSLRIKATHSYGVHLDAEEADDILLPAKDVPARCQEGDELDVFVYVDKEDHLQATTQRPLATVGEFASLQVVSNSAAGAFLHWGMENDLLVPKGEQLRPMVEGNSYAVFLFLSNKTNRIIASSKLEKFLSSLPPAYQEGEKVDLLIFAQTNLGYSALINRAHTGILYKNEVFQPLQVGQQLTGYIKQIREDQKIDLSLQQSGYQGMDDIAETILGIIQKHGGKVSVTDKSPPDDIYALFGVSKKVFKKAIGALYKKRIVTIAADGISCSK